MTLLLLELLRGDALSAFAASASQGQIRLPAASPATLFQPSPPPANLPRGSLLNRVI